jgi:hypothetical protein
LIEIVKVFDDLLPDAETFTITIRTHQEDDLLADLPELPKVVM